MNVFTPFPTLQTENLVLRRILQMDLADLFEMRRDPRMHEHTDTKPDEVMEATTAYYCKMNQGMEDGKWVIWAIEHKTAAKVIGTISIWNFDWEKGCGELGYGIIPEYQGRGLMKEALRSVIAYGFDSLNLKSLEAYTEVHNLSSVKLLEHCGFIETAQVEEKGFVNDRTYLMHVYSLEKDQSRL